VFHTDGDERRCRLKRIIAAALVVVFASVYSVAPVFAGGGPTAGSAGLQSIVKEGPKSGEEKNPNLAGLMSAILPCTGQWYNGELLTWKSAAMAAIEAGGIFVLVFFLAWGDTTGERLISLAGGGVMIANHAWSGWDAWRSAKRVNEGLAFHIDEKRALVSYNIPF
jgi:hypothetical protein